MSSRIPAILGVLVVILIGFQANAHPAYGGSPDFEEPLFCGQPLARQLAVGAIDPYVFSLTEGTRVSLDLIPTGSTGLLKMQVTGTSPTAETCTGEAVVASGVTPGILTVSDCQGEDAGPYTLTMSVVSEGADNCAVALPCATPLAGRFAVPGEVDSYTFPGVEGQNVRLVVTDVNPPNQLIRLRLFDPAGTLIADDRNTCSGSLQMTLPKTGAYTTLVSKCTESGQVDYTLTWDPETCLATPSPGEFAYVGNGDSGTVSAVDLASNRTKAIVPIAPLQAVVGALMDVAVTPNGGFAWVTYETASTVAIINTSTNLTTASVPVGGEAAGVTFSPDGSTAYVVANDLLGVAIIDTMTNQIAEVIAPEIGFSEGIETSPDGSTLYVMSDDELGLFWLNPTAQDPIVNFTPLDLGLFDAFAVSPDGAYIYAGTVDGIVVIDTAANLPTNTISTSEPFAIAFSPDGRRAFASLESEGTVIAIDTTTYDVVASIPVFMSPAGLAVSPDGSQVYVTDSAASFAEPGLAVIDTAINQVVATTPTFGNAPVTVSLTTPPTGLCVGDAQGETKVTIDELVRSVNYALNGCPGRFPGQSVPFP